MGQQVALTTLRLLLDFGFSLFLGVELSLLLLLFFPLVPISALVAHLYFSELKELELERKPGQLSRHLDILGTKTLFRACLIKCNCLSFAEFVVTRAYHTRGVEEQVLAAADIDKSETFVGEPLDCTFSHDPSNSKHLTQRLLAQECPGQSPASVIIP